MALRTMGPSICINCFAALLCLAFSLSPFRETDFSSAELTRKLLVTVFITYLQRHQVRCLKMTQYRFTPLMKAHCPNLHNDRWVSLKLMKHLDVI